MILNKSKKKYKGFILIPVVLMISVLAVVTMMIGMETSNKINVSNVKLDDHQINYVTQAGVNHGLREIYQNNCGPFSDISDQPFGDHEYSATITPNNAGATTNVYTIPASQDTYIRESDPNSNFGNAAALYTYDDDWGNGIYRVLYQFDIAGAGIPINATVVSAVAKIYVKDQPEYDVNIHRITKDWTENAASWNNINTDFEEDVLASIPGNTPNEAYVDVNITPLVQGWVNGSVSNQGIVLRTTIHSDWAEYSSKEHSNSSQHPVLEITTSDLIATHANITSIGVLDSGLSRTMTRTDIPLTQAPITIVWQPGDELKDTYIDGQKNGVKKKNYGASPIIILHHDLSLLIQFPVEALPPGAQIIDAKLSLYLEEEWHEHREGGELQIHAITRSWTEGDYDDQDPPSNVDAVTFTEAINSSIKWDSEGGDYDPAIIDSIALPNPQVGWVEWTVTDQINKWLKGAPNHGFLLRETDDAKVGGFNFVSSDNTTTPEFHPKLTITMACECGITCLIPQGSGNLLMVVGNLDLNDVDETKRAFFESWGYTVSLITDSSSQSTINSAINNNDVIYVSVTSDSVGVGDKLNAATIGLVNDESALTDDLGISQSHAFSTGRNINIVDTSHYITQIFSAGDVSIFIDNMQGLNLAGTPSPELQTLGNWDGQPGLVVIDPGGVLQDGSSTTPASLVQLPLGRESHTNWNYLNNNGRLLIQRSIEWAKDNPEP